MAEDTSQPSSGPKKRKSENGDKLQVSRKAHLTSGSAMEGIAKYFFFIMDEVSSDWRKLAFLLGFGRSERENINERNRDDKHRCMDLLEEWHNRIGREATVEVLMEALSEANLQRIVDSLKNKYPELRSSAPVLPVRAELGMVPQKSDQGSTELTYEIMNRLWEMHRDLFTAEVLMDDERRSQAKKVFLEQKAFLIEHMRGSVIFLLTFLRQTDVDRFYHNHYRVGEGSLSQQLSHILISDELQRKVKGAQLIVRLQVKHEDYVRVRNRLGRGLDRTTSIDNILALPAPSRRVDHFCVRGLDLAIVRGGNQSCTESTDDVTAMNFTAREVQTVLQTGRKKSQQQMEGRLQVTRGELQTERQESKTLKKAVTTLTQEMEKAEKIVLEQTTMREEMQKAKDEAEVMCSSLQKTISTLEEKDKMSQRTLQKQNQEIKQMLETKKSSDVEIGELTAENTKLISQLTDIPRLREEIQGLREKDETSQKFLSEQRMEIRRLQETIRNKEEIINRMEEQINTARQQTEAMVQSLRKGITRLEEEKKGAQKILQTNESEIQQLQEVNKSMAAQIEELLSAKQPVEGKGEEGDCEKKEGPEKGETKTGLELEGQAIRNVNQAGA
ncbi:uncharacterized protein LOC118416379 [Branchiostoma floridae]|uniref:Uncharacterized protein LOC118416379 n=1 Tax=Branchiostoma floridae TaxID=7739 RepID=A0A9J7L737_BRAFL|nr:uncharacterized protein LOC118416379 [Branchiostoma floridae]